MHTYLSYIYLTIHLQFLNIDEINIPNKIMHTLQKLRIVPNYNPVCTNDFSTVDILP
jgi:hypothetical protein